MVMHPRWKKERMQLSMHSEGISVAWTGAGVLNLPSLGCAWTGSGRSAFPPVAVPTPPTRREETLWVG